ncbi:MAG: PAS domain S-box protein [Melioribacter sp.]|nr:PAS domain S-box protein [Melioribacter sp.]
MNRKSKTKKDSISELKSLRRKVNRLEKAAKLTNTRLNETQSMTHIGSWELDLIKNNLIWSDEIYRMFEIDHGKFGASYEAFLNAIHPEDRDAVNLAYTNSVKSKTPYSIDHRLLFPGGRIKFVHEECQTFYDGTGNAIRSVGTVQDITDRVRAASKMRESEEKFAAAFYSSPNLIAITRFADGKIIDINEGYTRLLGYSRSESIGKTTNELSIWANPADRIFFINSLKKFGHITDFETTLRRKDGMLMTVIDSARIIELQGEKCVLSVIVDITERKLNELTIYKLNRIYKVLSETNQLIVREKNRDRLLKEICRIAVEYGGILMASISFVDKKTHKVIPTAWFGKEEGYFSSTKLSIENISEGKGPTGTAIRENRFVFSTDIETEPMMEPWREQALLRGYRSSAAFPLCEGGKPIGAFTMFASEPNFFTDNELTLMNELAMDVSYALENIQTEEIRIRTEKLMHQSEEKFSNAFWFSPVALSISSMEDMKYIEVNESFLQLTGYNASEVIGHTRDELNLWMHHEHLQDFIKILNEHGTVKNFEFAFRNKNGELKYGLRSASIITIGGTRCILSQTYDITEKKKAEEERLFHLKFMESLDMVTRTIQGTNDLNQMMNDVLETVFSIFDCDRIWLFYPCDPDASSFRVPMEITKPEYPGAKVLNVDIPMPPDMSQNLREALESADPLTYIVGTEKPVNKVSAEQFGVKSMMMVALRPKSGKPWAFGMHQCSTPRIWIEEEVKLFKEISSRISDGLSSMLFLRDLQESEERFRRLTENARDVIYRMSLPDGKYEYISPAALFVFGYSPEEFYNTASLIKQAIHPDWQKYFEEQWANLMKGEMPPTYEYQIIHKSGEARWLNQRNILVHDNDGNPIAIEGIVTDITEHRCAENVILESEKRFKELANLLPQTIFESDINGVITFANETGLITFGYSLEDISKGFHMISMVSEKDKLEAIGNMQRLLNGQSPSKNEYEMVRKDGTTFPALTFNAPIIRNGKTIGLRGTLVDITQRKLVENELSKLSEAVAQSPASIVITDINGNIVYVNKTFEETTGYSFDEVINQNPRILKSGFMPKEEYAKLWDTITSGNTWHGEFQNKKKNGEVYWEDAFISPIKDKDGNTINYLAVKQDITEKKKMTEELITAKDQAEKSDKLKSEFLAQMSHEIRSPLNVTINLASLIKEDLGENISEQTAAYFEGIELASRRLIRTVDLILNISEIQVGTYSPTFEKVDLLNDILENLRKEFNAYAKHKGLEYIIQSTISESFVYCDRYSVNQILCNLIDNAIKYTKSGKVEVIVERDFKENVKVTVSDTGIGISKEFMDKMFQPFMQEDRGYSRRYEGTGLGLALVKKYCDLNEATIDVKSEKDIGSKFIVTFFKKES